MNHKKPVSGIGDEVFVLDIQMKHLKCGTCRFGKIASLQDNRVDIAMHKNEYHKARRFGRQKLHVKIIEPVPEK